MADVWDALTSDRAYRRAWDPDDALAHLLAGRGSHFDPVCIDVFTALMAETGRQAGGNRGDVDIAVRGAHACHHRPGHRPEDAAS